MLKFLIIIILVWLLHLVLVSLAFLLHCLFVPRWKTLALPHKYRARISKSLQINVRSLNLKNTWLTLEYILAFCAVGRMGRKRKRKRAGHDGKRKESRETLPPFPSSHRPPRAFYFSIIVIFIGTPGGSLCGRKEFHPGVWKPTKTVERCISLSQLNRE